MENIVWNNSISYNANFLDNFDKPNKPNPFNTETTIEYYLPSTISNATLYIYDLQGKQIKSINIVQRDYAVKLFMQVNFPRECISMPLLQMVLLLVLKR